ncbi:MSTRO protein, partial [Lophotis ruficrista]|nr:MSTRO protein [Lophotis ruficrista]
LLPCPDISTRSGQILQLAPGFLHSECTAMRHLVLRGLVELCKTPVMAKRTKSLLPSLIELLKDADTEVVEKTLSVLSKVLLAMDIQIPSNIALQLAERLRPLFDNESRNVRVLSIRVFGDVMMLVEQEGRKALKAEVHQSLILLVCHLHDK